MKRRSFLTGLVATTALAGPAFAQDFVGGVVSQLKTQGFRSIEQARTLLGRVRITASRRDGHREIIVNPNNGEILRDLWTPVEGGKRGGDIIGDSSGNRGSGPGDDDDDDEDDDDDGEDGGNDGGGNSGSGNDDENGG